MIEACIRPVCSDDAKAIHHYCYPEARFEDVRDYLDWCLRQAQKGWVVRLVAVVDGQAVANAQLTVWGQTGEIGSLVVAECFRRQGLARQLLTALIAEAKRRDLVALEIGASERQPATLAFYERVGFRRMEAIKEGLSPPDSLEPIVRFRMDL